MAGNQGFCHLISLINKLQDVYTSLNLPLNIDLPQIAVVGSQSAGKSSVLENFVGRDFLPRGSGIVTRCPLVLQLINGTTEYGVFQHNPNRRFTDFDEIRREIEAQTDRIAGSKKNISNRAINLRVYSPYVLNLTLVDLPGLTKVPVGDQPPDIDKQIRNMVLEFIKLENCLILAVSPANSDLANSDALKIAREVDPECVRTIGVITKLDLMDEGTDARDILENRLLPLRRGYVGVVNRSQKDIDGRKDIRAALESERRFFVSHPAYRHLADRLGTPYLQRVLNEQLTNHIREVLPSLRYKLQAQLVELEKQMEQYKHIEANDASSQTKNLLLLIQEFGSEFIHTIDGQGSEIDTKTIRGGANINRLFHEIFPRELSKAGVFGSLLTATSKEQTDDELELRREIRFAIRNIHGIRSGLFTPDMAFDVVVRKQVARVQNPTLKFVDLVVDELYKILQECLSKMDRFPRLRDRTEHLIRMQVQQYALKLKEHIESHMGIQLAYINTDHDDFIGFANASAETQSQSPSRTTNVVDQVIRRGRMNIQNQKMMSMRSEFWFVLKPNQLIWYKDEDERAMQYSMPLENLKLRDVETSFLSRKYVFALFHIEGRNVYKDNRQLELGVNTVEEATAWKQAFLRAGVYTEKRETNQTQEYGQTTVDAERSQDPVLERQVEIIRNLVDSYMRIINKTHCDYIPKVITHYLINQVKYFIKQDLFSILNSSEKDMKALMEVSQEELQKKQSIQQMFSAVKDAVQMMNDVSKGSKFPSKMDESRVNTVNTNGPPVGQLISIRSNEETERPQTLSARTNHLPFPSPNNAVPINVPISFNNYGQNTTNMRPSGAPPLPARPPVEEETATAQPWGGNQSIKGKFESMNLMNETMKDRPNVRDSLRSNVSNVMPSNTFNSNEFIGRNLSNNSSSGAPATPFRPNGNAKPTGQNSSRVLEAAHAFSKLQPPSETKPAVPARPMNANFGQS